MPDSAFFVVGELAILPRGNVMTERNLSFRERFTRLSIATFMNYTSARFIGADHYSELPAAWIARRCSLHLFSCQFLLLVRQKFAEKPRGPLRMQIYTLRVDMPEIKPEQLLRRNHGERD